MAITSCRPRMFTVCFCRSVSKLTPLVQLIWKTYEAFLGPLSKVPGPFVGKWTTLYVKYHTRSGSRMQYIESLHAAYGTVNRQGPGRRAY